MRLLLDEHFSASIVDALRLRGHDVAAVQDAELGHLRGSADDLLFAVAQDLGRALVTENVKHFRVIADRCYRNAQHHAGLVYTNNASFPRHRHDRFIAAVVNALDAWLATDPTAQDQELFLQGPGL